MKYNQYGDVIFTKEEEKQMKQFRDSYERGWSYQTNDPYDEMDGQDFVDTYIRHFKKKRDRENQKKLEQLNQESQKRDKSFLEKIINHLTSK